MNQTATTAPCVEAASKAALRKIQGLPPVTAQDLRAELMAERRRLHGVPDLAQRHIKAAWILDCWRKGLIPKSVARQLMGI